MDNFIVFLEADKNLDAIVELMVGQIYLLIIPFVAGLAIPLLDFLWDTATYEIVAPSPIGTVNLDFSSALGVLGIGNSETLFLTIMGLVYNAFYGFIYS